MKQKMRHTLAVAIAAISFSSGAQSNMLADLYEQARNYDAQLLAAQAQSNAGQQAAPLAKGSLLPSVTLNGSSTKANTASSSTEGFTLSLSQPLFDLNKWYSYERAETLTDQAKLGLELAEQQLIVRLVNAYLDVLSAKGTLEVAQSRERAVQRRLDQVNAQFEVGLIAITDVLEARASYDDARVGLIDATGALSNSFEAMERVSGIAVNSVAPLSDDYPIVGLSVSDTEQWVYKALQGNLQLRNAKLSETAATQNLEAYRGAAMPTLSLSFDLNDGDRQFMGNRADSTIGLRLSVPLYRGGATTAAEQQAGYQAAQTSHEYDDKLREITQTTRELVRDIETSVASVEARMKSIESRETALEATEQGFEVGTRNVVDVLEAENSLFIARQNFVDARLGHIRLQFALKQAIGTLSPDDLATLDDWLQ